MKLRSSLGRLGGANRQALIYTVGSLLATGLVGIAKLLLARKLSVASFAQFALTLSVLQYMALLFSDFGLIEPLSRMLAQSDESRRGGLVGAALTVYLPLAALFSLIVFAFSFIADAVFKVKIGAELLAVAPLAGVWPFSSYIGMMLSRGRGQLGLAAVAAAVGQAFVLGYVLAFAGSGTSAVAVVVVVAGANWLAALLLVRFLKPAGMRVGPVFRAAATAARRWGTRAYVGRVLGVGTYNMDVLMLAAFASDGAVANYTLTTAVTAACGLPAVAYSSSLYGKLTAAKTINRRLLLTTAVLALGAIPISVGVTWGVVEFVLPAAYEPMILLAIPLGLAQALRGMGAVFNVFLVSHGRGKEMLWQGAVLTASNLVLNFALIPAFAAQGAAWASAGALVANLGAYLALYRRTIRDEGAPAVGRTGAGDAPSQAPAFTSAKSAIEAADNSTLEARLSRIGPRPVLVVRMAMHRVRRRRLERKLRADYAGVVVPALADVNLTRLPVELPSVGDGDKTPGLDRIVESADNALAHRTDLLGAGWSHLGDPIDWHADIKSGYRWDPNTPALGLQITRLDDSSDAKMPWEVSRSHQMLALARAARATGDARYRDELQAQLQSWIESNPPGIGINWTNAMEVSIRAINWVWAIGTLPEDLALDPQVEKAATESLRAHARHIANHLEGSPLLRGNHYLADEVGLFVLGWALEGDEDAARFARGARKALEREIQLQIHDDGMNFEASTSYHGLAIELFLIPWIVAEWAGEPFSEEYRARLVLAVEASLSIRRPDGMIPLFGDNDSSRVLPFDDDRSASHDPLLWLAAGVIGTPAPSPQDPDPDVAWVAGPDAAARATASSVGPVNRERAMPDGGIWVMERGPIWVAVRCGDVGQEGTGGHAHNDALSFECSIDGCPLVVDPGTFVYTADREQRNRFRSTAVHSTLAVVGREINPIDPNAMFQLRQASGPAVTEWLTDDDRAVWSGYHDGWLRLPEQVVHTRRIEVGGSSGSMKVTDRLTGSGRISAVATLQLAPGLSAVRDGDGGSVVVSGEVDARVAFAGDAIAVQVEEGLVAPRYGVAESAPVLKVWLEGDLPLELETRIERVDSAAQSDSTEVR